MSDDPQLVLCPYCGHTQADDDRCGECGGLFEPLSRRATQIAMGPWYVRDRKRPYHPGCSYEVLKKRIAAGAVRPNSVLRGPTTRQFWALARNVPGVAHLLGYCHECRAHVEPSDTECPQCGAPFPEVDERNELGLQFPTQQAAQAAQAKLEAELEQVNAPASAAGQTPSPAKVGTANTASGDPLDMADNLLGQIISTPEKKAPPKRSTPSHPKAETGHAKPAQPTQAAQGPAKAPAKPAAPAPEPEEESSGGGMSMKTLVILLIGINLVVLLIILVLFAMDPSGGGAQPPSNPPATPTPAPTSDSPTAPGAQIQEPGPIDTDTPAASAPQDEPDDVVVQTTEPDPGAEPAAPSVTDAPEPQTDATADASSPVQPEASDPEPSVEETIDDERRARVARFFGEQP